METKEIDEKLMHTVVFQELTYFDGKPLKVYVLHSYLLHHISVEKHNFHDVQTVFAYAEHDLTKILTPFRGEFDKEHKHSDGMILMYASSKNAEVKIGAQLVLFRETEQWNQSKFVDYWTFESTCGLTNIQNTPSLVHKGTLYEPRVEMIANEIELREQTKSMKEFLSKFPELPKCLREKEASNTRVKSGPS
jgi:hypothetical protein